MFTLNCKGRMVQADGPVVMGILNVTPDSFYSASRHRLTDDLLRHAERMLGEGALFLDIGGQSTRPGSEKISVDEEMQRVLPAIEAIVRRFPDTLLSIDTFYARVARYAVDRGVVLVNDVSAGSLDPDLLPTVAELKAPYVLMHMKGNPQTMQAAAEYTDVTLEVFDRLNELASCLIASGIYDLIIDPGFGFGKTAAHNFSLLHDLSYFRQLNKPLMVGLSRKGTIYRTLGITPEEALNGTTVLHTLALANGADILRVHDVKEAVQAITLYSHYAKKEEQ